MKPLLPVGDADLDRARQDPAYRHRLLQQSLDVLLGCLQKQRQGPNDDAVNAKQTREGVALAVRLAEMIQAETERSKNT